MANVRTLTVGGVTYNLQDTISGYITGITSSDVTTALGFTPYNSTNPNGYTTNTGTVTSVRVQATSPVQSSTSTEQTSSLNTTISLADGYGDTKNPYGTKTAHYVLIGPSSGSAAAPTFRALVASDIPDLSSTYLTSYTETDPTVPSWAKADSKPSYTFSEIGSTPTTLSGYGITNAYTKTEVDGLVAGVLHYKGTKATTSALPSSGNVIGDVWHVTADGSEWAWDGTEWQELGTVVDLSNYVTTGTTTSSSTTGITISDHSTTTIYGVSSTTTSVTGVSGSTSIYGVKSGTNSTTTASKASGGNGTAPTLGDPIEVPNITSVGTASTWSFTDVTVPIRADADTTVPITGSEVTVPIKNSTATTVPTAATSATTVPIKNTSSTTVPTAASSATVVPIKDVSATDCDDITNWSAGSGSLTFTMDSTDTKKLVISHTHTAPSLSYTPRSICGVQSSTTSVTGVSGSTSIYGVQSTTTSVTGVNGSTSIYGVQSTTTSVTGVNGSTTVRGVKTGTSSTTTASKASGGNGTAPTLGDPISVPNVTSAGSASTWSFTDVTVPIRADSATTVPTAAASATTVPVKDTTATTVVTSKTHTVNDSGHTHTV